MLSKRSRVTFSRLEGGQHARWYARELAPMCKYKGLQGLPDDHSMAQKVECLHVLVEK
jgi:hypothetical protein